MRQKQSFEDQQPVHPRPVIMLGQRVDAEANDQQRQPVDPAAKRPRLNKEARRHRPAAASIPKRPTLVRDALMSKPHSSSQPGSNVLEFVKVEVDDEVHKQQRQDLPIPMDQNGVKVKAEPDMDPLSIVELEEVPPPVQQMVSAETQTELRGRKLSSKGCQTDFQDEAKKTREQLEKLRTENRLLAEQLRKMSQRFFKVFDLKMDQLSAKPALSNKNARNTIERSSTSATPTAEKCSLERAPRSVQEKSNIEELQRPKYSSQIFCCFKDGVSRKVISGQPAKRFVEMLGVDPAECELDAVYVKDEWLFGVRSKPLVSPSDETDLLKELLADGYI